MWNGVLACLLGLQVNDLFWKVFCVMDFGCDLLRIANYFDNGTRFADRDEWMNGDIGETLGMKPAPKFELLKFRLRNGIAIADFLPAIPSGKLLYTRIKRDNACKILNFHKIDGMLAQNDRIHLKKFAS